MFILMLCHGQKMLLFTNLTLSITSTLSHNAPDSYVVQEARTDVFTPELRFYSADVSRQQIKDEKQSCHCSHSNGELIFLLLIYTLIPTNQQ